MKKVLFLVLLLTGLLAGQVYADAVFFNTGTTNVTTALTGYSTLGDQMAGMKVTVFRLGGNDTATWSSLGSGSGNAVGAGWSLYETGDTFGGTWTLSNAGANIYGFRIDAGAGSAIFDTRAIGDVSGTDGSARGWNFERTSSNPFSTTANYYDAVALTGNAPVGDLFRLLEVTFQGVTGASGYLESNQSLTFIADTDSASIQGDIKPVPIPAPLFLLFSGLLAIVPFRKKK